MWLSIGIAAALIAGTAIITLAIILKASPWQVIVGGLSFASACLTGRAKERFNATQGMENERTRKRYKPASMAGEIDADEFDLPEELLKRAHDTDYRIICELLDNPPDELLRK